MAVKKDVKKEVQVVNDVPATIELKASPVSDAFALIEKAITANAPIETMERLLAMRDRLRAEQIEMEYREAMADFQAECPIIDKTKKVMNKDGRSVRYKYAPIESIVKQVQPLLKKTGFSFKTKNEVIETPFQGIRATVMISHIAGHSEESSFDVPMDKEAYMTEPQKWSSAATFAKRIAFCNGFGILTGDEDNDGDAPPTPEEEDAKNNATRVKGLPANIREGFRIMGINMKQAIDLCVNCGWDEAKILKEVNKIIDSRGAK